MTRTAEYEVLQQPDIYPEATSKVEVYETHISWVYLTDRYVYKIKKPLDLGFLDFSTLERRRFFFEQELALNRRLSTDVYLDVIPIHQSDHHVNFNSDGAVVDYAVKMRRLSEAHALHTMLRRGPLSEALMTALAERLTAFHRAHPLPSSEEVYGTLEHVRADWEENFVQTADHIGQTLSQAAYDRIQYAVNTFMYHHADWFAQRVEAARIRDCHGDLRAEHIYVDQGAFQIIDCIEFNHRFRYIDVASEVAFLAMDLDRLGAPDEARQFVQAYVLASGDAEIYRLLEFYCCYRAYVRGKVISMRLQTAPPDERVSLKRRAETYFSKAACYASRLIQPMVLLTTGLIGTGKSTIANQMATVLDLEVFSSDHVRKRLAGASSQSSPGAGYGQGLYGDAATPHT
jgi:aminoglycoside phosphotransferase family enzyme